ncbi:MAG TPA: hypothetical protein VJZ78_04815 [Anaerolineales bacterium]|nr:hypothetical protein [Anaerolineales bacterium]
MFKNNGLILAIFVMAFVGGIYALGVFLFKEIPEASSLFGHLLGIVGFILMLMTEFLYSFRKRSKHARWGKMSDWLEFHIFTGLVGPFLVLLHSSWKFQGLAGAVMLMTILIVLSGLIGRYIYTAIPHSADGTEILFPSHADNGQKNIDSELIKINGFSAPEGSDLNEEQNLVGEDPYFKKINSIEKNRRLLAIWHTIHIPLGMALFTAAFIHIFAALYYATFSH